MTTFEKPTALDFQIARLEKGIQTQWECVFYWMSLKRGDLVNDCKRNIDELEQKLAVCIKKRGV